MRQVLVVVPDDRPGELARIGEVLGAEGINIDAISASTSRQAGLVQIVVDRTDDAFRVLHDAAIPVMDVRDALVVPVNDVPGRIGGICRRLADAGINIDEAYLANDGGLIVVCEEVERARQLLGLER